MELWAHLKNLLNLSVYSGPKATNQPEMKESFKTTTMDIWLTWETGVVRFGHLSQSDWCGLVLCAACARIGLLQDSGGRHPPLL